MAYWLMKSEPSCFSIDHLANAPLQTTHWDGVRNYQARNFMRDEMRIGDLAFFYHSNCRQVGIVGTMTVTALAYPDHTAWDPNDPHYDPKSTPEYPRWYMVDLTLKDRWPSLVTLQQLKETPELASMLILRKGNRLSITPISETEWQLIHQLQHT